MTCNISNSFSFDKLHTSTQNAHIQYTTIIVNKGIQNDRIWNFKINAISKMDRVQIKYKFQNCILLGSVRLSELRFNGNFSGSLSFSGKNIFLSGLKSNVISYNWNPKLFEFTIFFNHLQKGQFFADLTLQDGSCDDPFQKCFWENLINGSCTAFAKAFTGIDSSVGCGEALAECEAECIAIGGGPEDPFADVICSASCGSLEAACEVAVDQGSELSAQELCSAAGL